jgi:predicted acetyltransferase
VIVKPDQRRKGHGRAILRLALERVRTPLCVATVRVDNVHWLRVITEEGFREVETLGSDGSQVRFLVRQVRRGVAPPHAPDSASPAPPGNA